MDAQLQTVNTLSQQTNAAHTTSSHGAGPKVSHQGVVLQIKSMASSIADIAEEASLAVSEKVTEKSLDKRGVLSEVRKTAAMERAENYLKNVADAEKKEKLNQYLIDLHKHGTSGGEALKQWLSDFSSNHSEGYSALEVIKQTAEKSGNKALAMNALQLQQGLMEKHGEHIRASFNIIDTTALFNGENSDEKLDSSSGLINAYQDTVLDYGGVARTFRKVIEAHGEGKFPQALDFLRQALGADLSSQNSSVAKEKLEAIISDIKDIFTLKTLLDMSNSLISRLQNNYGEAKSQRGQDLMSAVLKLTEAKWISQRDLTGLSKELDIKQLSGEVYFGHQLKAILSKVPATVFPDDNARNALLEATLTFVHGLVEKEELL